MCVYDLNGQKGYGLYDLDISNGQIDIKTMKKTRHVSQITKDKHPQNKTNYLP